MPELPEVEVTRRGVARALTGATVTGVRRSRLALRWPVPAGLERTVAGQTVRAIARRGKYLIIELDTGWLIVHLGMSGSLRVLAHDADPGPWDHFDLRCRGPRGERILRLTDPRRFGGVVWHPRSRGPVDEHPLLANLGIEPFDPSLNAAALRARLAGRRSAIKTVLLAGDVVVGVGNIYASEALFRAGIHPQRAAASLSPARCARLIEAIRATLSEAIELGGSSLRDYVDSRGEPGHFQRAARVYGRAGEPCGVCGTRIRAIRQGQRTTYYCPRCQR